MNVQELFFLKIIGKGILILEKIVQATILIYGMEEDLINLLVKTH